MRTTSALRAVLALAVVALALGACTSCPGGKCQDGAIAMSCPVPRVACR